MAPQAPKRLLHSLPPILRMICQASIPGYSKGSRGLSVLPRVCGIFTTTTISPSPSLRQCSSRYAIHARRNLPDKEFRYLRTLIVRAAVYGCFGCQLLPEGITAFLNIPAPSRRQSLYVHCTCWQRPVFLINSRQCRFSAPAHRSGTGPLIPKLRGQFA
jgi:hypothetical protein